MAASNSRRGAERGATLTIFAFVTGLSLLALGTVYMTAAEKAYTYAVLRTRQAQVGAAADAGLLRAVEHLRQDHGVLLNMKFPCDGIPVEVASEAGAKPRVTVTATFGKGPDEVKRALVADIDFGGTGGTPRVLSVKRQGR